jgi:ribosomal-protein-alanine N-acetyltransferase
MLNLQALGPGAPGALAGSSDSVPRPVGFEALTLDDLDLVWATEKRAHGHPWSRGNFEDAIRAGHPAWLLTAQARLPADAVCTRTKSQRLLLGYGVALASPDVWHVLNLVVSPDHRRQGWGRLMLQALGQRAQTAGAEGLLLEVRESNKAARALYASIGFEQVGHRKDYYPAGATGREHAMVLRWLWQPLKEST